MYVEGEKIKRIFFIVNGVMGYVLDKYSDRIYCTLEKGDMFGLIDLIPNKIEARLNYLKPRRKFSIQVLSETAEALALNLEGIGKLKQEYPLVFDEMFIDSLLLFKKL